MPRFLVLILLAGLASPVFAEKADREKPVHLEADSVTLDDVRKLSVFQGNVMLTQGTLMMRADHMEATQNDDGLQNVIATGKPVSFRQKRDGVDEYIEGFAGKVSYDGVQSVLQLEGDARLRKGSDEIKGAKITYDAKTEYYKVVGQQNAQGSSGRVRVTIKPKPKTQQPEPSSNKPPQKP